MRGLDFFCCRSHQPIFHKVQPGARGQDWEDFKARLPASKSENVPGSEYVLAQDGPAAVLSNVDDGGHRATEPGDWEAKAKCLLVVAWCEDAARLNTLVHETTLQLDKWRRTASDVLNVNVVRRSSGGRGGMNYLFLSYSRRWNAHERRRKNNNPNGDSFGAPKR